MCCWNVSGNPKKRSDFICLKCLHKGIGGIQRGGKQREKGHIKNLHCFFCNETTPHLEVRYCDNFKEMTIEAERLHMEIYEEMEKRKYEQILYS